ncbi:hypothetical protein ACHAPT_005535 [Fusarium lateritium]
MALPKPDSLLVKDPQQATVRNLIKDSSHLRKAAVSIDISSTKRALLIASPFQGLRGPLNDVQAMEAVLREQRFLISRCYDETGPNDTVVIYYSGHGGIVEDSVENTRKNVKDTDDPRRPWRYQFLVPVDFKVDASEGSFGGILDVELAHLLRKTTDRTTNVTVILDCCHSGRMARDPSHPGDVAPRNLPEVQHAAITSFLSRRELSEEARLNPEGNSHAVRIVAAASSETAWEHRCQDDQWAGVMTQALVKALKEAWDAGKGSHGLVSWRTTLLRVRELVKVDFPQQHPQTEGCDTRLLFSLQEAATVSFVLHSMGGARASKGIIDAGRVSGVREGNVYDLMPLGTEQPDGEEQIKMATATHVNGFKAKANLLLFPGKGPIPKEGVLAFLSKEALLKWPIAYPHKPDALSEAIEASKYLQLGTAKDDQVDRIIALDGSGAGTEGENIYISLENKDNTTVYASVFDFYVAGMITFLAASHADGIELHPDRPAYTIGEDEFEFSLSGLEISWPADVPKIQPVDEHLIIILTDSPIDLRYLANTSTAPADSRGSAGSSSLEQLAFCLATGAKRDVIPPAPASCLRYDTLHIPFALLSDSRFESIDQIPPPEAVANGLDLPSEPPYLGHDSKASHAYPLP